MPLFIPVLLGAGAAISAIYGGAKGYEGVSNLKRAEEIGNRAQRRHATAVKRLERKRDAVSHRAKKYGRYLVRLSETTLEDTRVLLETLQAKSKKKHLSLPRSVSVQVGSIAAFTQTVLDPPRDFAGIAQAAAAGSAAGGAAMGMAGLVGTAGTGAAIGGLSGAAATNATLAWLGGGSLAAGGGGMAVGTAVIGGVVAGPAIAVTGFVIASKGEKALTKARKYESKIARKVAKLDAMIEVMGRVETRVDELHDLTKSLNRRARAGLAKVDPESFDRASDDDVGRLTIALQLVKGLSMVMQTPVLDESGDLTKSSAAIQLEYRALAGGTE